MSTSIKLLGADDRFSASIVQLLKLKTKNQYVLAEQGEITLIDADSIEGKKAVERKLDDRTIFLTVLPDQLKHKFVVKKPIKVDELLQMLEQVMLQPLTGSVVEPVIEETHNHVEVSGNPFAKFMEPGYLAEKKRQRTESIESNKINSAPKKESSTTEPLEIFHADFPYWQDSLNNNKFLKKYYFDEVFEMLTSVQSSEMANLYGDTDAYSYDMSEYACLAIFREVVQSNTLGKIYYVEAQEGIIFLFEDGILLSNFTVEQMIEFAKVQKKNIEIKSLKSQESFLELFNRFDRYYYGESRVILSRIILLEAKGRLINEQDIKEPLGLMSIDELKTSPILMAHSKDIDNIWCYRNVSLRDTAELLTEINPYHIFSYYTLCYLYGFFDKKESGKKTGKQLDLNTLLSELQKL